MSAENAQRSAWRHPLQKAYIALATLFASAGAIIMGVFALGLLSRAFLAIVAAVCAACAICGAAKVAASFREAARAPELCAERFFLLKLGMVPCLLIYNATATVLLFAVAVSTILFGLPRFCLACAAGFALLHLPGACYGVQTVRLLRQRGKGASWAVAHGLVQFCFPLDVLDALFLHREWARLKRA